LGFHWHAILSDGRKVGDLTNCVWSRRLKKNVGFALISTACQPGEAVEVVKEGRRLAGSLRPLPFL